MVTQLIKSLHQVTAHNHPFTGQQNTHTKLQPYNSYPCI